MKKLLVVFTLILSNYIFSQEYIIKDKTKYYVASTNFGAAPQYNLILDKEGYKTVAKSLGVSNEEAKKIIEECSARYQPKSKRDNDYGYIMYKICEVKISLECNYFYGENMFLMYFPNELNTHMPPDKLATNGKGFFQLEFPDRVSTIPNKNETYKPQSNSKNDNYSFGFIFNSKGQDSIVIEKVIHSSHAKTAGLQIGDVIVAVNDIYIRYYDKNKASEIFKNCGFSKNNFTILRNGNEVNLSIDKVNSNLLQTVCISGNCNNGDCIFENINGYTIQGKCVNGVLQGKVKFFTKEGVVFYEGEVYKYNGADNNYKYKGFGLEKYPSGDKYEGQFQNGFRDGEGIYTKANGEINKGFWKEGKYYDEIARGFDNEKIKTFVSTKKYLYEQKQDFLTNANQVTFEEKSIADFKKDNALSDVEFDKLMKLCDFKYKPTNLSTPTKLKKLINDNQENYPYTIFSMGYLKATDGNYYSILRMPEDLNRWLPETMRPTEEYSLIELYFLAPYGEVQGMSYLTYIDLKKQRDAAEFWKKTEEKNAADLSAYWNEKSKNEYKGIAVYQFSYWNYNQRREDYDYTFVSVFGPPGQELSSSDYIAMDKLAGASGDKIAMEFFKGKDESYAEEFAASKTGIHRFSITKRYNYYMPQKNNNSTTNTNNNNQLTSDQIKKIDQAMEDAYENLNKLTDELDDSKTSEKIELRKKINEAIFYTDGDILNEPTKVTIINISTSDKYYNENKKFIGKTGTVEGTMLQNSDGTFYGMIKIEGEKTSTIFYQVELKF